MKQEANSKLQLLAVSHGLNHVYQLLTPVIIPEIAREYGLANAALFLECFVITYSLLPTISGYISQVFGRKKVLSLGFAVTALAFLAIAFTNNIAGLAALFLVAGAGGSTYHPNGTPLIAEIYSDRRGQAIGLHVTGGVLGSVLGPLASGVLVAYFTLKPALVVLAIPGLVLSLILWRSMSSLPLLEKSNINPVQTSRIRKIDLKTYGAAFMFIAAAFVFALGQRGTDAFANEYFVYGRNLSLIQGSLLFSSLSVAGLLSAPLCGFLSDRFDRKKVLAVLVAVESASLFAITLTPNLLLVVPCIVFGFASFGAMGVGEAFLADLVPAQKRNIIFGINYTVNFSGSIILIPILFTTARLSNFNLGFLILSAIIPLSIILIWKTKVEPDKKKQCTTPTQY